MNDNNVPEIKKTTRIKIKEKLKETNAREEFRKEFSSNLSVY